MHTIQSICELNIDRQEHIQTDVLWHEQESVCMMLKAAKGRAAIQALEALHVIAVVNIAGYHGYMHP